VYQEEFKDITAHNQFTKPMFLKSPGLVIIDDTDSISATITLYGSINNGVTWIVIKTWTAETIEFIQQGARILYKLGVETGDFTSGTATVGLIDSGNHNR